MPLLFAVVDYTEIQERLKREKQLKETQCRLQQTVTDLSSRVRAQRTALAKLLALLQLPVVEDDAVAVDASFEAIEVRVKERSSHPLESMVEHDSICLASFGLRPCNFEYQLTAVTNTLSSCGIICSFR